MTARMAGNTVALASSVGGNSLAPGTLRRLARKAIESIGQGGHAVVAAAMGVKDYTLSKKLNDPDKRLTTDDIELWPQDVRRRFALEWCVEEGVPVALAVSITDGQLDLPLMGPARASPMAKMSLNEERAAAGTATPGLRKAK